MKQLEHYLKHATKGTFGKTRDAIRLELEANIRIRATELQLLGISEERAILKTLEELGAPNFVSTGMTGVYTMPKIAKASLPITAGIGIVIAVLSSSLANINFTDTGPLPTCTNADQIKIPDQACLVNAPGYSWLEISSLIAELKAKGVNVEKTGKKMQFPGGWTEQPTEKIDLPAPQLEIRFPDDQTIVLNAPTRSGFSARGFGRFETTPPTKEQLLERRKQDTKLMQDMVAFTRDDKVFLNSEVFVEMIKEQSRLPVYLNGWKNPQLQVGKTTINFGSSSTPTIFAESFKNTLFGNLIEQKLRVLLGSGYNHTDPNKIQDVVYSHRVHLNAADNSAFGILHSSKQGFILDLAPIQNGILEFDSPFKTLRFTTNLKALDMSNGTKTVVALVRLTGRLNYSKDAFVVQMPIEKISNAK